MAVTQFFPGAGVALENFQPLGALTARVVDYAQRRVDAAGVRNLELGVVGPGRRSVVAPRARACTGRTLSTSRTLYSARFSSVMRLSHRVRSAANAGRVADHEVSERGAFAKRVELDAVNRWCPARVQRDLSAPATIEARSVVSSRVRSGLAYRSSVDGMGR